MRINSVNNNYSTQKQQSFGGTMTPRTSEAIEKLMRLYHSTRGLRRLAHAEERASKKGLDFKSRLEALTVPGLKGRTLVPEIDIDPEKIQWMAMGSVFADIQVRLPGVTNTTLGEFSKLIPEKGNIRGNALLRRLFKDIQSAANQASKDNIAEHAREEAMQEAMAQVSDFHRLLRKPHISAT